MVCDEILMSDHSTDSYSAVLSCGAVYYVVHGGFMFEFVNEILTVKPETKNEINFP